MTDKDLLKRRIDTYNNLISRLDRITSANYMHIVAGMRCTLKAMIDNNLAIIDSTQENPCNGCTNRKGCITCENGELKETVQKEPVSEDFEKIVEEIAEPTILNAYGTKEIARRLRNTICGTSVNEDLEEAAKRYSDNENPICTCEECLLKSFKAGATWQRQQDEHLIWQISSANYEKGIEEGKKHIMKDAVEDYVMHDELGYNIVRVPDGIGIHHGDKVKVIIIKEG